MQRDVVRESPRRRACVTGGNQSKHEDDEGEVGTRDIQECRVERGRRPQCCSVGREQIGRGSGSSEPIPHAFGSPRRATGKGRDCSEADDRLRL